MKKIFLALGAFLLLALDGYSAPVGLSAGITVAPLSGASLAAAIGTSQDYALNNSKTAYITWQTVYSAAPSTITITLEGSTDCSNYFTVDTSTNTSGEIRSVTGTYKCVRFNNSAVTGGAGKTVTATILYSLTNLARVVVPATTGAFNVTYPTFASDFLATNQNFPLAAVALNGGTSANIVTAIQNHPGVIQQLCHTTNANSGHEYLSSEISLSGGEVFTSIFRPDVTLNVIAYVGGFDQTTPTTATDGVYFKYTGTTLIGQTSAATVTTSTATSYTISAGTWYKGVITINSLANQANFYLYDAAGTLLWSDVITSNIPNSSQTFAWGDLVYVTVSPGAVSLMSMDYAGLSYTNALVR